MDKRTLPIVQFPTAKFHNPY